MGFHTFAQQATGNCLVPGTSGQLSVEYYNDRLSDGKDGHLIIYNNSGVSIPKVHIKVTVRITWTEVVNLGNGITYPKSKSKVLELCNDEIYDIPREESIITRTRRGVIKGGPQKEGKNYSYSVEIRIPSADNISNSESQAISNDDELIYSDKKIYKMNIVADCKAFIVVDVYKTSSGNFYANMKSPESKKGMNIFKLNSASDNAYIEYGDCQYSFYLNQARW